ncbi:MAG: hypothetical protein KAQ94_00735 [Arcobacteraceae bacterium]|nr:hypothetical protein [Arcobacteraceae bacterium]
MINVLVISISNPILVGIYENNKLIETISKEGKTSDVLPMIFDKVLKEYNIDEILYVNGPGSFMAIKVAYMFLKTLSIINDISFKACDGFYFNNNSPIKALAKKYFFKSKDGKIEINFLKDKKLEDFKLPQVLDIKIFSEDSLPNYNLPAVN